jgi:hypothetical protein
LKKPRRDRANPGSTLEWDRFDQGQGSDIQYELTRGGLLAREASLEIQERMLEAKVRFQKVLGPYYAALVQHGTVRAQHPEM